MPITNVAQIKRFTELCGAAIPQPLLAQLEARADDPEAVVDFGVAYATRSAPSCWPAARPASTSTR